MTPEQKKIYDIQSPQTKRLMDLQAGRPVEQDEERAKQNRFSKVSSEAQVTKPDGSVDINVREISTEEYAQHTAFRYRRGAQFEEARTAYLKRMAAEGKIHISLMNQIETNHVMPPEEVKDRAEKAYLGILGTIKEKFKILMESIFKPTPSYADIVAEAMKEAKK